MSSEIIIKCMLNMLINIIIRPGGDINGADELSTFLHMALTKGYQFKTVDTYLKDNDS